VFEPSVEKETDTGPDLGPHPRGLECEFDIAVGVGRDAGAVAGVQRVEVLVDGLKDALDALDQQATITFFEVGPAKAAVGEDEIAGEQDPRGRRVETEVVVLVARGVEGAVVVVAQPDRLAVGDGVVDAVESVVEPPDVDVEGGHDVLECPHVIWVGVGQHDSVQTVDVLAGVADDVEPVADVDQHGPVAGDEEDVARKALLARREVPDHGPGYGVPALVDVGIGVGGGVDGSSRVSTAGGRPGWEPIRDLYDATLPARRGEMSDRDPVVLIVEDEPEVAETYRLWLQDGYEVRVAQNGDEGLDKLDDEVDVVLLDRMMPGLSGDQVLELIREEALGCRVAMVTAVEPDFDILEMGFDAYLSKPIGSDQLEETIENLLDRSEYDDLLQEYYSLVEKQATLEATKSRVELADSEEYERLTSEIGALRDALADTLDGIEDDEDFIATVRRLGDVEEY